MTQTYQSPDEIIVGIDNSEPSRAALRWAADYARATGGTLRAVYVHSYELGGAMVNSSSFSASAYRVGVEAAARHRAAAEALFAGVEGGPGWGLELLEGSIDRLLVERATNARLLVVGTREHRGLDRILVGSVSHYCLSHASCPVVAVPASVSAPDLVRPLAGVAGTP